MTTPSPRVGPEQSGPPTVTLWRVECIVPGPQEGRGPYTSQPGPGDALEHFLAFADWLALRKHGGDPRQMDTHDDGLDRMTRASEFCACDSMESLRGWFHSGQLEALTSTGWFGVVRYEVPASAVQLGAHQAVFDRTRVLSRQVLSRSDMSG